MDWQVQYLRSIGAPTTAANLKFLNTWQRYEGGATNNSASFNYLNTTYGKGYKSINSVGVKAYPDLQTGAQAFAQTLEGNRNYSGLLQGLRTGNPYASKDRVAAGLSTWLSGSPTKGLDYASKVLGTSLGADSGSNNPSTGLSVEQVSPQTPVTPETPSSLVPDTVAMNAGMSPRQQLSSLVAAVASQQMPQATPQPVPAAATPPSGGAGTVIPGSPISKSALVRVGGEHPTAGLAGFPARDYFANAGAPVVAPVGGTIVRFSGHDPRQGPTEGVHGPYGWSVYLKGNDGRTYYLTHLGSRTVKVGQTISAGAPLGTVGDYAKWGGSNHVHMGVEGV